MNKRNRGFTLIEILIVILIILILAGILFPVFSVVKGRAQTTKCATHIRQLGMAITMYSNDHDDLPPMGGYDTAVPPTFPLPTLQVASTTSTYRVDWEDTLIGMAYVRSYTIFACPSAPTNDYRYSYGVNRWVMGWGTSVKLDSISYPSNTALMSEKTGYDWPVWLPGEQVLNGQANPYYFSLDPRHANQLNVLFVDGHVRRVAVGEAIQGGDILWKF